ncbi:hypothetical protein PoB_007686400 [Plakobranchus ocellatus]|uniref:Uncharacterized protein n=1 Tax=Plakobranchus ocellatus TaxID=259542 RepID=A0AAV4E252_9GAST|nr:hypothetical protein PoB_007686400 [Plakobranchus ocellatus]
MSTMPILRLPRHRLLTPEINTYACQMQQCQRRSEQLPFQTVKDMGGGDFQSKLPNCSQRVSLTTEKHLSPYVTLTKFPERKRSYYSSTPREGSFSQSRRHSTYSQSNASNTQNSSRKASLGLKQIENFCTANQGSKTKNGRCSSSADRNGKHGDLKFYSDDIKAFDYSCEYEDAIPQKRNLREAKVVAALHPQQEYLLHALTTLAINSLSSELTPRLESEKRLAAVTHLGHKIVENAKSPTEGETIPNNFTQMPVSKSTTSENCSENTLKLDEFFAAMEETRNEVELEKGLRPKEIPQLHNSANSNRNRINQLRNYLRYSGYGEPVVKVTSASKSDKLYLTRLLQRMRRNCSPHRQERLRLRARLDYEMSIMKAVSFCEQQEQVYFRSASVDMENTDLQMLEDDLKYQALQEMRRNAKNMDKDVLLYNATPKSRAFQIRQNKRKASNANGGPFSGVGEAVADHVDGAGAQGTLNRQQTTSAKARSRSNTMSGSCGYEGDIMSGLLGSPLSKQEMQDRIQLWLASVEKAMAGSCNNALNHDDINY